MARSFARSDAVRAEFLGAAADLARERDWAYLALHQAGPIGGEAARRLGELRGLADRGLDAALSGLAATDFVPLLSESVLADVASTSKALRDNRAEVDGALARPRDARPPQAADRWYSTVSTLITATQNLRFDLLRALPPADKLLADHSSLKQFVWIASEQASRGRALLAGVMAERRRPTDNEFATLASADAQIGLAWRTVQAIVGDEMAPEVTGAVAAAQRAYFGRLMPLREQVYKAAREASPYPVTAEQWFARASDAIDSHAPRGGGVGARDGRAHDGSLVARARRTYLVWAALGVLGLLAVALCVMILEKRVLAPLRALTVTMASLAKGDLRAAVPRHPRRDELGAMAHALRRLKTAALQAQRLRAAKERAERQALQAIRDREVGLRAIFDSVSEGIVTVAADGRVEAANPAAGALFGRQPEQLVGQSVLTLVPEPEAARYGTPVLHYLATGRSDLLGVPQEVAGLRADGSPVSSR
jgi:methyl-accepting chemotaxis protein